MQVGHRRAPPGWWSRTVNNPYVQSAVRYGYQRALNAASRQAVIYANRGNGVGSTGNWGVSSAPSSLPRGGSSRPVAGFGKRGGGRRYKKKNRKSKSKKRTIRKKSKVGVRKSAPYKGAVSRYESGGLYEDSWCCTIGHTTPLSQLRRVFFVSLVKMMMVKLGVNEPSLEVPQQAITAGDVFNVYYSTTQASTTTALSIFSHTCALNDSISTIAAGLLSNFETIISAGYNQFRMAYALFYPNGSGDLNTCRISLVGATVRWYNDSVMKLQNRTAEGSGNTEADDLVAQHVVGKCYYGNGNGPEPRVNNEREAVTYGFSLIGKQTNGLIGISNMNTSLPRSELKEPQNKQFFTHVTGSTAVKFGPGELKTSVLKYDGSYSMDLFVTMISTYDQSQTLLADKIGAVKRIPKAKFKMFMLEKEIEITAGTPVDKVQFAYQIDSTLGLVIDIKNKSWSARTNVIGDTAITALGY